MHTTLLVDSIAFPAARVEALLKAGSFKTSLGVETAIPTSTSLSANTKDLEPTPSLNSAALKFTWQESDHLYFKTSAGYFTYNNLPSAVAKTSQLLGNDVDKISDAQYAFMYKYEGWEGKAEFKFPIFKSLDIGGGAEYLINEKGPSDQNSAYHYAFGADIHLTQNTDLSFVGHYFSVAPEATVAYFTSSMYDTNRVGYSLQKVLFHSGMKVLNWACNTSKPK